MMKIKDYIDTIYKGDKILPLMHSMPQTLFILMMEKEKELQVQYCDVLKENLVYSFYGKPSYIINTHNDGDCGDFYAPVCLILDPMKISMYKVFPFDTGGYVGKRMKANLFSKFELDDFELMNTWDAITSFVKKIYDSNENYYRGKYKNDLNVKPNEKIIKCLLNIISSKHDDERNRTIEISSQKNINLDDAIIGIILPDELMEVDGIRNSILEWGIPYFTYVYFASMTVKEYSACIMQIAHKFLESNGYFT